MSLLLIQKVFGFGWFNGYIVGGICGFIFEGFNEVSSKSIRVYGDRNFWRRLLWFNYDDGRKSVGWMLPASMEW